MDTTIQPVEHNTVAHAFAELINSHDPDAVDGFIAENYVNHNAYVEDGRDANRAFWRQWFTAFPDTEVSLDDVLIDGDRIAAIVARSTDKTGIY